MRIWSNPYIYLRVLVSGLSFGRPYCFFLGAHFRRKPLIASPQSLITASYYRLLWTRSYYFVLVSLCLACRKIKTFWCPDCQMATPIAFFGGSPPRKPSNPTSQSLITAGYFSSANGPSLSYGRITLFDIFVSYQLDQLSPSFDFCSLLIFTQSIRSTVWLWLNRVTRWNSAFSSCAVRLFGLLWVNWILHEALITLGQWCRLNESANQDRHWKERQGRSTALLLVIL